MGQRTITTIPTIAPDTQQANSRHTPWAKGDTQYRTIGGGPAEAGVFLSRTQRRELGWGGPAEAEVFLRPQGTTSWASPQKRGSSGGDRGCRWTDHGGPAAAGSPEPQHFEPVMNAVGPAGARSPGSYPLNISLGTISPVEAGSSADSKIRALHKQVRPRTSGGLPLQRQTGGESRFSAPQKRGSSGSSGVYSPYWTGGPAEAGAFRQRTCGRISL